MGNSSGRSLDSNGGGEKPALKKQHSAPNPDLPNPTPLEAPSHTRRKTAADIEMVANEWLRKNNSDTSTSGRSLMSWKTLSSSALVRSASIRSRKTLTEEEDDARELVGREQTVLANPCFVSEDGERKVERDLAKQIFVEALGKSRLLRNTSKELREEIFRSAAVPVFVNEGDVLFEQGLTGHLLFVLVTGKFEATLTNWRGKRRRRRIACKQVVAEQCVLMNSPHEYTLTATTDGMILAVHRIQYQMTTVFFADRARHLKDAAEAAASEDESAASMPTSSSSDMNLVNIPLFAFLSKQQVEQIRKSLVELRFNSKERLVASRQIIPGLYIIKSGQVAVRAGKFQGPGGGSRRPPGLSSMESMSNVNREVVARARRAQIEAQQLFSEAEHDEIEWLTRGDYFGEAALLSDDAQLGVDVFCSSDNGATVLLLKSQDWKRILGDSLEAMLETLRFAHVHRLLNRSPVFSNLAEKQIEQLCRLIEFRTFQAGEKIVEGGNAVTPEGGMYLLTQGAVRLVPFHGLKQSKSFIEVEKRAQMLRESSRSKLGGSVPGTPSSMSDRKLLSSMRVKELEKGGSFTGLSPRFFGKQMSFSVTASIPTTTEVDTETLSLVESSDPALTTSIDHEALFASLGISERDYVVLLSGELFGEDGIRTLEKDRTAKSSVYAIGRVTVAYISLPILEKLGVDDVIRQAAFDELLADDRSGGLVAVPPSTPRGADETAQRLENSRQIARAFLNDEKMKTEELKMQHKSIRNHQRPRRESTTFRMTAKRLFEIKQLHKTPIVNVCLSIHDPSYQVLVVKELDVTAANKQGMGSYVLSEQVVLAQINSSHFVANMISSWEEPERLYLGLEPALCGDLGALLQQTLLYPHGNETCPKKGELGGFDFSFLQFAAACGVLALKHLYEHRIIHRDIKPNNIVMDEFGYCKLVDFGIAKRLPSGTSRTYSLCGSPKYMAPELVTLAFKGSGNPYTNAVDWWAFGVSLFELATNKLPYWSGEKEASGVKKMITEREKNEDALIKVDGYRNDWAHAIRAASKFSSEYDLFESHSWFGPFRAHDVTEEWKDFGRFLAKLMHPDPDVRLGSATTKRGPREAMDQPVFKSLSFDRIAFKKHLAPFIPKRFMVDLKEAESKQKAGKLLSITAHQQTRPQPSPQPLTTASESPAGSPTFSSGPPPPGPRQRPALKRTTNVESRVRANLEHPDVNNAKMHDAFQGTDQARKQMIMAREQHIRRIAFKQGCALDELDTGNDRKTHNLVLLQRAAVLETLQVFVETGGSTRARRIVAATRIQTNWRGHQARVVLAVKVNAVRIIHKFVKKARSMKKAKTEKEEQSSKSMDGQEQSTSTTEGLEPQSSTKEDQSVLTKESSTKDEPLPMKGPQPVKDESTTTGQ